MIQSVEADLLLELTYSGLHILSESQVSMLSKLFTERGARMKKDISLEAEEAIKADTEAEPEGDAVETPATLENESEGDTPTQEGDKVEEPTTPVEEPTKPAEEGGAEEAPAEEAPADQPVEEPVEEKPAEPEPAEENPAVEGEESEESSGLEEGKVEEPTAPVEGETDKPVEPESADTTEDKSVAESAELLKSIQDLTGNMAEVLKTNEILAKRVQELENQPASRKTVEIEKGVGDDNTENVDAKSLKEEMDEKIAQVRKDNYGNPNLFAMVQKIRADYSKKIKEQN